MLAIVAAILFGIALLLDLANEGLGDGIDAGTFVTAGLLCLALHLAGVLSGWRGGSGNYWRRRRR